MYDDNKNVDKKICQIVWYIWRLLVRPFSYTIMQDPAQQKNHAKSWPPICHSMTNKVVLLFSSPLRTCVKREREKMRNVYWEIWAQMKWENICEIFLPGFTLIPLLCFLLLFWVKPTSFYPYSTPCAVWVKGRKGGMGCGVEIVNGYNLTYLLSMHYKTCFLTFCRRKRFQHLQNEK